MFLGIKTKFLGRNLTEFEAEMFYRLDLTTLVRSRWLPVFLMGIFFSVNILANGFVAAIEYQKEYLTNPWKPWVWETTSGLSFLLILPFVLKLASQFPLRSTQIIHHLFTHILVTPLFSICHICVMVIMRESIYTLVDLNYQFEWSLQNLTYEFLKDLRVYLLLIISIESYRFIILRLQGEASVVRSEVLLDSYSRISETSESKRHFLVKKLHREFLITPQAVEWIESSGNYQNLHVKGQVFPMRSTHSAILEELDSSTFFKIGRGIIVNTMHIKDLRKHGSELEIELLSGQLLPVSKAYRDSLPEYLYRIVI